MSTIEALPESLDDDLVRELLAVPLAGSASDIYSGVVRMAGVLWCTRIRRRDSARHTVFVVVHPSSNFMGHYALAPLARLGVDAVGMTTRYVGNDSSLLLENCVLDVGAVIKHLRGEGYRRIILIGNSGGGGLAALYQAQAEHPTITETPTGRPVDLVAAGLEPADGLVLLMAHPGRHLVYTEMLDPAIIDEFDPTRRDATLDLFDPANPAPYSEDFISRYRAAQVARNERITDWVLDRLAELERAGGPTDLPFLVHGTCADPRTVDLTLEPTDREAGTLWGEPRQANFGPVTMGHYTSLHSWASQWSIRLSRGDGPKNLAHTSVPVLVGYGTADQGCFPSHAQALYDHVPHERKEIFAVSGGHHYLVGQPELIRSTCERLTTWAAGLDSSTVPHTAVSRDTHDATLHEMEQQ